MHFPLLLNKKIININNVCTYLDNSSSLEKYLNENNIGIEDSAKFWMRVHNLKSYDEFLNLVKPNRIKSYKEDINKFLIVVKECTIDYDFNLDCLSTDTPINTKLLKLFDEYFDYLSSERIVKELEKLI
jgi:ribosome-associated toxin RatA of RatAB toxin-antitoxin module